MADLITKLSEDIAYIQKLGNNPNFDNGLTADQLKAWFDKAPEAIKKYINSTLIPELTAIIGDMKDRVDIMNGQVDDFVVGAGFLPTVGGTMTGNIDMSGKRVSGLSAPEADTDATRKKYVDDSVSQAKSDLQDSITHAEESAKDATNSAIASSSLARSKSSHKEVVITLTTGNWANNMQTVSVEGVDSNRAVFVGPQPSYYADYAEAGIYCSDQGDGVLVFTCTKAPKKAISVNVAIFTAGDQMADTQLEADLLGGAS